ncbi:hypothetical protein IC582_028869 [Cucumis melo]
MATSKVVSTPLAQHIKISARDSPKDPTDRQAMSYVPYSNATGSLMYLMVCTRPDLAHSSSLVSRHMGNPGKIHWEATKWVFRYLAGTENRGLLYKPPKDSKLRVRGFVDADFVGDPDKRRSLIGFAFTLGENLISWKSNLQSVVALSTTKAEFIVISETVKEAMWLRGIVSELGYQQEAIELMCDN